MFTRADNPGQPTDGYRSSIAAPPVATAVAMTHFVVASRGGQKLIVIAINCNFSLQLIDCFTCAITINWLRSYQLIAINCIS